MKLAGLQSEMWHGMKLAFAVLFVALGFASGVDAQIPCSYEVSAVIQAPPGQFGLPSPTIAGGMSPNGRYVCGRYVSGGLSDDRAFVYDTKTSQFISLPNPAGITVASASDVNDAGLVVGEHGGAFGDFGFIYDLSTGQYTELPPLYSPGICSVNAINSSGIVCGRRTISGPPGYPYNAFIWSPKDGFTDLGVMNGPNSAAQDINDDGNVCGWTGASIASSIAFVHQDGDTTLLGPIPAGNGSRALAISNSSVVVGHGRKIVDGVPVQLPFLYDADGFHVLSILLGYQRGAGSAIHDSGLIVGNSSTVDAADFRACIWSDLQVIDLREITIGEDELIFEGADAISDDGSILVGARVFTDLKAAVLSPVQPSLGDANCNQFVDVDDLLSVINTWGQCYGCASDFTSDGTIDLDDLMIVLNNWSAA